MRKLFNIVVIFFLPFCVIAQESDLLFTLEGLVVDIEEKSPIKGAKVVSVSTDASVDSTYSDSMGVFELSLLPNRSYSIIVNKSGYIGKRDVETTLNHNQGKTFFHKYELEKTCQVDFNTFYKDTISLILEGLVKDLETKKPIPNAIVRMVCIDGNKEETLTDSLGNYKFKLEIDKTYAFLVSKERYLSSKAKESTIGIKESTIFLHEFELQRACTLPPYPSDIIYFKFNEITPLSLDIEIEDIYLFLYELLSGNPSLTMSFTCYRGRDEKKGISYKRAMRFVNELVKMGVNPKRVQAIDGGIMDDEKMNFTNKDIQRLSEEERGRLLIFSITGTDFEE